MSDQTNTSEIDQAEAFGQRVIDILFLKPVKPGKKREYFETVYGEKTNIGVGRSIIQILEETHNITPKEKI
tara:strand:- start:775 stop:987 length:213 start_codon:yes stop_codon:yes gene_type:complete